MAHYSTQVTDICKDINTFKTHYWSIMFVDNDKFSTTMIEKSFRIICEQCLIKKFNRNGKQFGIGVGKLPEPLNITHIYCNYPVRIVSILRQHFNSVVNELNDDDTYCYNKFMKFYFGGSHNIEDKYLNIDVDFVLANGFPFIINKPYDTLINIPKNIIALYLRSGHCINNLSDIPFNTNHYGIEWTHIKNALLLEGQCED
jgi:hypothetical protein